MNIRTRTRQVSGVTIVDISGRIVLGEESASLRDLIRDLLSKGQKQILLNLGSVDHIDSMGLGSLVGTSVSVRKQGGEAAGVKALRQLTGAANARVAGSEGLGASSS
jgi:anti-sigma B factor antagonist